MEYGIEWVEETVSRQAGDHASDRMELSHPAIIPVVRELEPFRAEFGDAAVLVSLDGTSIRVMAQDVNRRGIPKGMTVDQRKAAILNRIRGLRNAGTRVALKVYSLPGGAKWSGTDLSEYQSAYIAAGQEVGLDSATLVEIARTLSL